MPTRHALNEYHIMATVHSAPTLLHVFACNRTEALTSASRQGTDLLVLFATRSVTH